MIRKENIMPQHVVVVDYDPAWEEAYGKESRIIRSILGENCVEIHHIGSTSVPCLAAKPIIDILVGVKSLEEADCTAEDFEKVGYEYLGEFGIPGRRYLRKGGDERTHQIHIFAENDRKNIDRHLAFRDYMRTHERAREVYGRLKKELAEKYPYDIERYCDGKDAFVREVEEKALETYRKRQEGRIRPMEAADLDAVTKIWLDANRQAHDFIPAAYWEGNLAAVKELFPLAEVYIWEEKPATGNSGGRIEGNEAKDSEAEPQGFIGLNDEDIEGIFVRDEARSRGIGKSLMDFVKAEREYLRLHVYEKNARALSFYRREGFAILEEGVDEATGEREFVMGWTKMRIERIDCDFSVCQVTDYSGVNWETPYCFVGRTPEEQSLVCPTDQVPENVIKRDDGWKAMKIQGVLDFSLIGILSKIATILAEYEIGIFAVSTYNTDYILTKGEQYEKALKVLAEAEYEIV